MLLRLSSRGWIPSMSVAALAVFGSAQSPCDAILRLPASSFAWNHHQSDDRNVEQILRVLWSIDTHSNQAASANGIINSLPVGGSLSSGRSHSEAYDRYQRLSDNQRHAVAQALRATVFPPEAIAAWRDCMREAANHPWAEGFVTPSVVPAEDRTPAHGRLVLTIHYTYFEKADLRVDQCVLTNLELEQPADLPRKLSQPATVLAFRVPDRRMLSMVTLNTSRGTVNYMVMPASGDTPPLEVVSLEVTQRTGTRREVTGRNDDLSVWSNQLRLEFNRPIAAVQGYVTYDDASTVALRPVQHERDRDGLRVDGSVATGHVALLATSQSQPQVDAYRNLRWYELSVTYPDMDRLATTRFRVRETARR